jgi:hypothetical protein
VVCGAGSGSAGTGAWATRGVEVRLDRRITGAHLVLNDVEELEVLTEDKDVLGTIVPGEGGRDLRLRGLTAVVAMLREGVGVGTPGDDIAEDVESADIADHRRELEVHLDQAFCMRWTWVAALCTRISRWRRYARGGAIPAML